MSVAGTFAYSATGSVLVCLAEFFPDVLLAQNVKEQAVTAAAIAINTTLVYCCSVVDCGTLRYRVWLSYGVRLFSRV